MLWAWFKFSQTAASPGSATAEQRQKFARMANWIKYFGLFWLVIALGAFSWWFVERQSYGNAPTQAIAASDFSAQDWSGKLKESRIEGVLQLDHIDVHRNARGSLTTTIPLTDPQWKADDPVRVFVTTHLFQYDQKLDRDPERNARTFGFFDLPGDSQGATPVSILVEQPAAPTNEVETLRGYGLNTTDDAIMVKFVNEAWRTRDLNRETDRFKSLGIVFGGLGLFFFLLGFLARFSILRFKKPE